VCYYQLSFLPNFFNASMTTDFWCYVSFWARCFAWFSSNWPIITLWFPFLLDKCVFLKFLELASFRYSPSWTVELDSCTSTSDGEPRRGLQWNWRMLIKVYTRDRHEHGPNEGLKNQQNSVGSAGPDFQNVVQIVGNLTKFADYQEKFWLPAGRLLEFGAQCQI
jgi:hypothetical protein